MPDDRQPKRARRRPTIDDVAQRAGVSSAAVSFAMNGRRGVGEDMRARILAAAAELGWSPSAPARAEPGARRRGRPAAGPPGRDARGRPVLPALPRGRRARAGADRPRAAAAGARQRRPGRPRRLRAARRPGPRRRLPAQRRRALRPADRRARRRRAAGGRRRPPGPGRARSRRSRPHHAEGLAAATAHLVERGHTRIGFLGGVARYEYEQARLDAWRAELARAGLRPGPSLGRPGRAARGRGRRAGLHERRARRGRARGRPRREIAVPGGLALTGFDDSASPPSPRRR